MNITDQNLVQRQHATILTNISPHFMAFRPQRCREESWTVRRILDTALARDSGPFEPESSRPRRYLDTPPEAAQG